ncbi:Trigger_N domain-containing protein [Cephalotus follicularis]|uniref:peptidylprolyl isomerase n=1 Tax=Cephalotus follicularis TaxID=3775 RepID=A0A1Q3BF22_CEPFO|nr:Trigger_N domain-containing protein [Cephalotus follicularis]
MASMTMTTTSSHFQHTPNSIQFIVSSQRNIERVTVFNMQQNPCRRMSLFCNIHGRVVRQEVKPIFAVGSGLEASISDPKENVITFEDAKIVVESQDENKMKVRVDVNGAETQMVFDKVLAELASSAPPIPGFRRQKGGKTTKVPKDFLLQVLGEERVRKFVIQEIVTSTLADYAKKENLNVKDKKISTTQTVEELKKMYAPGNDFGFNAVLELEKTEIETSSSSSSDV